MLINFNEVMTELDGTVVKEGGSEGTPLTLAKVATTAITTLLTDDKGLSGTDKFELGMLAQAIYPGGEIDLSVEDIAIVKKRIGMLYGPVIVVQTYKLLDKSCTD